MGYTAKYGHDNHGHYATKDEAYAAIKNELRKGTKPAHLHTSTRGVEYFQ